jgi:hypothetical protein
MVKRIDSKTGKEFIRKYHYAHGSHNGPMCWGLFDGNGVLIGVLAFATPCSENVRSSIFGPEHKAHVTELHRLVILDRTPKNTESWFISRALKQLKLERPDIWAVVSFADESQGHTGTIYQATNAIYYGKSSPARFYIDETGRLRHPRQNGVNISIEEAERRGWKPIMRQSKHRYVFLLADTVSQRKFLRRILKITPQPYPKHCINANV